MILPYLQQDNRLTGVHGSRRAFFEQIAKAQDIARPKTGAIISPTSIYDLFENGEEVKGLGIYEGVLAIVANSHGLVIPKPKNSFLRNTEDDMSVITEPLTPNVTKNLSSGNIVHRLCKDLTAPSPADHASCLSINKTSITPLEHSGRPLIRTVEPIEAKWKLSREISPNNFFYHSSKYEGRARLMIDFLDDESIEADYKEEMKNKYGWLKRFADEPWTRSQIGTRCIEIADGKIV